MTYARSLRRSLVVALTLSATLAIGGRVAVRAQNAQATPPIDPQAVLPLDPDVRSGALPNGMQYFIRRNGRPEKRVALRLAVKSGSLEEADDQQGLAHLIEHMAFNGSAHFKPGELVTYFERVGARLGPHVNAYTSFDETVYMLDLPADQQDVVNKGLTALADFAGGLTLDPKEIDKERGVVVEEWRGRLGASTRVQNKQFPTIFYNSRYADRIPIGKPEIIRNAPAERLRAFYDTWYRPERMAVVAVGDIDAAALQQGIADAFGPLKARAAAAPVPNGAVTLRHPLLTSIATDPELTSTSVELMRKRAKEPETRVVDYRRSLIERIFERILNERLAELARKPDAKFLGASAGESALTRDVAIFTLSARVPDGKLDDGVTILATEAKRARDFGVTAGEVDRTKKWLTAFYEQAYAERDKSESGSFAQEYLSLFLEGEPSPGIAYEYRLMQQLLPGISTAEVNAIAKTLLDDDGRVMLAVGPQKDGLRVETEGELTAALRAGEAATVTAWTDASSGRELMPTKPTAGGIATRRELTDVGVTVVRFANGVEAWLKPTTFKNDQIVFSMTSQGGASLARQEDFEEASLASAYARQSGLGDLRAVDLQKLLAGKIANATAFIALSTHGISGNASPADLETALQLLYEEFTIPGDDPEAFALIKRQLIAAIANRGSAPGQVFGEKVQQVNTSGHYTSEPLSAERIEKLDREKMKAFYHDRFSNAADFTFFMVGAFKVDDALPLLAQYVGALPSKGSKSAAFKDIGIQFPSSVRRERVVKGREPRGSVVISFFADPTPDPVEQENIGAATTVLDIALRDILREELGQTYTVSVGLSQNLPQRGGGHIQVSFGAAPENLESMTERVMTEVRRLQREGPGDDLTNRAKESARRNYEQALQQNSYWLGRLQTVQTYGRDPKEILTRPERIAAVTPKTVQDVFTRYFPLDRYTVVTLYPETGSGAAPGAAR